MDEGTPEVFEAEIDTTPANVAPPEKHWTETIEMPEGVELSEKVKGYKTLPEYIKGMQEQSKLIGKQGIIPPAEGEDNAAFLEAVKPHLDGYNPVEVPETYEIEALNGLDEDRKADIFADMKALGFDQDKADGTMEIYRKQLAADQADMAAKIQARNEAAEADLKGEWGDNFSDRMKGAERVADSIEGLKEEIEANGLTGSKPVLQLLDQLARASSEDSLTVSTAETRGNAQSELSQHLAWVKANGIYDLPRNNQRRDDAIAKTQALQLKVAGVK